MRRLILFVFALTGVFPNPSKAQDQFDSIRDSIRTKMQDRRVPSIAVAVAQGDKILWQQGFGWADRERHIPADENTMYSLASISKPLTATALMTLVSAGKIDLDRPINDYLGTAKLHARVGNAQDATVRRVANHTSGLPEYFQFFYENESWRAPSMNETVRRFGNLVTAPGEHFQYSNLGFGLLADVIARVSGKSYPDYMRQEVFLKLGMTRSAVGIDPALREFEATRYDGEDITPIVHYSTDHPGASEIYSSAHDMALFGMFSLKEHLPNQVPILSDAWIDEMQRPTAASGSRTGYGVGWEVNTAYGPTIVSHSGGMPGVATWLRLVPSQKLVIVVLCNEDDRLTAKMRWERSAYSSLVAMATMHSTSTGNSRCIASRGPGVPSAKPKPWRTCACQRTTRRCEIAKIIQLRRADTPSTWEVAITSKMACLVSAGSQVPAIGPTNPHSFFFARWSVRPPGRRARVPFPAGPPSASRRPRR